MMGIKNQFTLYIFLTVIVLLFRSNLVSAQNLEISAHVNRTQIGLGHQFELIVELSGSDANNAPQPDLPDIEEFTNFIGTSSSQNIQLINGQMTVSKIYTHHFIASKQGKFQISAIKLAFKGKIYTTDAIAVEIVKQASTQTQNRPPQNKATPDSEDLSELLFLKTLVNKRRVYQNEPVIVTYKIYTAVNITSYGISQLPNTVGFWSEDFPTPNRPKLYNEVVNGRQFRVAEIKKVALFPQGPGAKILDPMKVDCEVQLPRQRRRRDIFDSFFDDPFFSNRSVRRSIHTNSITIDILPLPDEGKPVDFSGAVGSFSIMASVDKNNVKTNEAITLKIKLSGIGNIKILPKPKVDFPSDFEVYDPKISENIKRANGQISGSKTFEYVLIPRFPGRQVIKPISFSYFDLATSSYKRKSSKVIEISVSKGDEQFLSSPIGSSKEDVKFIGQDIRFIQMRMPEFQKIGPVFYKKTVFYFVMIVPLLILVSAVSYRKHLDKLSTNVAYARSRKANQMALKRLRQANKQLHASNQKEFYSEVSKALMGFVGDKINVPAAGLITDQVDSVLRGRGINDEIVANFLECLNTCDYRRFAPGDSDNGEMRVFFDKARKVLINLDKEL